MPRRYYIDIIQKKTGAKVSIPCKKELLEILEKYGFNLPHLEDQTINRLIKKVAEKAGLTTPVTIETSKGGVKKKETFEKYKLVMSHTARRTGATLMYLAGIDAYDIIKITGHGDIDILKRYIKADQLDVSRNSPTNTTTLTKSVPDNCEIADGNAKFSFTFARYPAFLHSSGRFIVFFSQVSPALM